VFLTSGQIKVGAKGRPYQKDDTSTFGKETPRPKKRRIEGGERVRRKNLGRKNKRRGKRK